MPPLTATERLAIKADWPRNSVGKLGGLLNFGNQIAGISAPIVTGYLAGPANSFSSAFTG
jgi:hypothetical protein